MLKRTLRDLSGQLLTRVASGQPSLMIYYEAESPVVLALNFVKEIFDGL